MSEKPYSPLQRMLAIVCTLVLAAGAISYGLQNHPKQTTLPFLQASASDIASDSQDSSHTPTNILLIGQDRREGETVSRADTILLCTFHPDSRKVVMTSFLRDLYVPIPGYDANRLNAAYAHGGMPLLRQTLEETFGLSIDGCVEVDFSQFADVLDILGGVSIELRQDEADAINKTVPGTLTEGTHLLSGSQALAYTRIRNLDDDGDFSRTCRQRKVISALLKSYKGASVFTVLSVIPDILPMLSTDMEKRQIISTTLKLLPMLSDSTIFSQTVPAEGMYTFSTIRGMSVLTADLENIRQELANSLSAEE